MPKDAEILVIWGLYTRKLEQGLGNLDHQYLSSGLISSWRSHQVVFCGRKGKYGKQAVFLGGCNIYKRLNIFFFFFRKIDRELTWWIIPRPSVKIHGTECGKIIKKVNTKWKMPLTTFLAGWPIIIHIIISMKK